MAVFSAWSSWMKWPASGKTWSWYFPGLRGLKGFFERGEKWKKGSISLEKCHLPCICPIMSSLSSRSVPASKSNFPPFAVRNLWLRPMNQPSQKGCVAARLVRQVQGAWVVGG